LVAGKLEAFWIDLERIAGSRELVAGGGSSRRFT
jgi:hypothetical protein